MSPCHLCPKCRTPWPLDYGRCPTCKVIAHYRGKVEAISDDEAKLLIAQRKFHDFYEARLAEREAELIAELEAALAA